MLQTNRLQAYATDPAAFRNDLMIETGNELVPLGSILDGWQDADFRAADPGWRRAIGHKVDAVSRCYFERGRGHSKTQDLSVSVAMALAFAPRQIIGIGAGADSDQARLLADAIQRLIRANPLLAEVLEVQRNVVVNTRTKSELRIISSDVGSSYGILADFIVVDELTHWTTAGEGLWHSLLSTAAKKPNCLLVIISNAGVGQGESWQWNVREAARTSDTWHFHSLNGAVASWISPKLLDEQKRLLPAVAYRRLWENQWCTLTGDALDMEDIERVFANELGPLASKESGYVYAGGLDLSVSRDHSSFVVVGRNTKTNAYRVARCWLWKPPRGGKVNLEAIEETIVTASKLFGLKTVACDPFQAAYLIERLTKQGIKIEECPQTGRQLVAQCQLLLELVNSATLTSYAFEPLEYDLRHLKVETRSYGMRLLSERDEHGHGDTATALTIALTAAKSARHREFALVISDLHNSDDLPDVPTLGGPHGYDAMQQRLGSSAFRFGN